MRFVSSIRVYIRCYATIVRLAVISDPFLDNDSVNTFPRQQLRMQRVIYAVREKELKRRELGQPVQLPVVSWELSCAREAQKRRRYSWVDSRLAFCTGGCDKRTWAREAEESSLVEAVARDRLKTQQAGERLHECCADL
jgi:hypothetical protein